MTYEEYKKLIGTATPENFQSVLTDVLNFIQDDAATAEAVGAKVEEQEKKIRELQDTNQRLFLSQTKELKEEPEDIDLMEQEIKAAGDKKGIDLLR